LQNFNLSGLLARRLGNLGTPDVEAPKNAETDFPVLAFAIRTTLMAL